MVLHLSHVKGGFGVTFNDVTKDDAFYTTTSRFVTWFSAFSQELVVVQGKQQDSVSWSSSPRVLLWDIHSHLIVNHDCKDTVPPQSQSDTRARVGHSQQDGDVHHQEDDPLFLPQLTNLHEAYHVRGEDASNIPNIPFQHRVTMCILKHWNPFC